jgi:uncharacterized protein YjdB
VAVGAATITAISTFDTTKRAGVNLTVSPQPAVNSVAVSSPHAAIIVGTNVQLTATVTAVGGASTAVTWSSSAAGVATVSATGLVAAVAPGNAMITATSVFDGTKQGSVAIRVDASAIVNSVTVQPTSASVNVGATTPLTATVSVGNNASQAVTWSSRNEAIATVDSTGRVTGVAAGMANIRATAQADATKFAESVVTVTGVSFPNIAEVTAGADLQFQPAAVDIAVGGTVTWNFQSITHNVTFASATGAPANIGNTTNASASRTFTTAGTFLYDCTLHGGMSGRVVVH